jgi:hypothetical protein
MTPVGRRLMVILLGYFAAGLAAGAILIAFEFHPWFKHLDSDLIGLMIYGILYISVALLLPALAVLAVTEALSIRSPLAYAALGAFGAVLLALVRLVWVAPAMHVRDGAVMAGAGIVAGVVYWSIAGRNAGGWRKLPPPGPTAQSTLSLE